MKLYEMGGACGRHGGGKKCLQGFGGQARKKEPLVRSRRRGDDNSTIVIKIVWEGVYWIHLAQNRDRCRSLMKAALKILVP